MDKEQRTVRNWTVKNRSEEQGSGELEGEEQESEELDSAELDSAELDRAELLNRCSAMYILLHLCSTVPWWAPSDKIILCCKLLFA